MRKLNGWLGNTAFYQDSQHFAFIRQGGVPEVWNVSTRRKTHGPGPVDFGCLSERNLMNMIALSADDSLLAAQGAHGSVTIWDIRHRSLLFALPDEHGFNWSLAWSPDRNLLAAGYSDGTLAFWNMPRVRDQLAQIGLDWNDSPAPASPAEQAEILTKDGLPDTTYLFDLKVYPNAKATMTAEGNAIRADVAAVDGTDWHAVLEHPIYDFEEGETSTIRFRARAEISRLVRLTAVVYQGNWHSVGLDERVSLTNGWQNYEYEFQAKNVTAENVIHLSVGERTGKVWISDFSITRSVK
jgi:hypothetical protein